MRPEVLGPLKEGAGAEFAERVITDDEFGERARQLLAQLR
jgi:hypothetical protein